MNTSKILFLVCFLSLASVSLQDGIKIENCALIPTNSWTYFFTICPLARQAYQAAGADGFTYFFSIGAPYIAPCDSAGGAGANIYGKKQTTIDAQNCKNIAKDIPSYSIADESDRESGLVITFPPENNVNLTVTLKCKWDGRINVTEDLSVWKIDGSNVYINGTSVHGCPVITTNGAVKFIREHKVWFVIAAVIIGLFICFFGLKVFHVTIFLVTFFLGTLIVLILFFTFVDFGRQDWVLYIILGASVILGLLQAWVAVKFEKVGFFALGAYLGVTGGFVLFDAVISHLSFTNSGNSEVLFYVTLVICGLIGGLLTFWLWKDMIIIATSVIGGYLTVRSLSFVIGYFPNELDVAKGIVKMDAYAYAYLAAAIILAIVGMYYQFKVKAKEAEKEEAEDPVASYYTKA